MTRLTSLIREAIADAAIRHAFEPREAELAKAEDALAREAYAAVFTAEEIKAVAKVPANWFRPDCCLNFNAGGMTIQLNVIGDGLPVPYQVGGSRSYHCHSRLGDIPHGDLADRIQAHANAKQTFTEDRRRTRKSVEALLNRVTTIAKLREIWPEGEQFYAVHENAERPSLPALRVDEINAALGLGGAA